MKGYAKVNVTSEHKKKIAELINKIDIDRESLQKLYDSTRFDERFNRIEGFFNKRNCYDTSEHFYFIEKEFKSDFVYADKLSFIAFAEFLIETTQSAEAIRKINELSSQDEIYLDDQLMIYWNKHIES